MERLTGEEAREGFRKKREAKWWVGHLPNNLTKHEIEPGALAPNGERKSPSKSQRSQFPSWDKSYYSPSLSLALSLSLVVWVMNGVWTGLLHFQTANRMYMYDTLCRGSVCVFACGCVFSL